MLKSLRAGAAILALAAATAGHAAPDRTVLPIPPAPFSGTIGENVADSTPAPITEVHAPAEAPNILLFMSDDVGFAMSSAFGGPVPTPNFDRLARDGERYNRFHTTGICAPSRAALLTGRNHHNVGTGYFPDMASGYPGYAGRLLPNAATVAQVLRLNGYNTAMFGKHHGPLGSEQGDAGPFDDWPLGLGFEHFFGFIGGTVSQWTPMLYRDNSRVDPDEGKGELLDARLADDIIRWVHNQNASAPKKPFFVYLAPGSAHSPQHAPADYIARFKGQFDQGWDKVREETFRRQLAAGIIPKGTKLTSRPPEVPAWDSLSPMQKAFAARSMEVAAAQLAFQDAQFGRVLDELERMHLLDKTLIVAIQGDNGASGEGGPQGTINSGAGYLSNGPAKESDAWLAANIDRLGGPDTDGNYPVGWAWAMDTPFRWTKQYASMLGGIRNGMIVSWQGHVARPGSVCGQFSHLIDIYPTLLDAAKLPVPSSVMGTQQTPLDGRSLLASLSGCEPAKPRTQYFEMSGKVGLYRDGWFLSGEDGRLPWEKLPPTGERPQMNWTLYDLSSDFSQSTDLSAQQPQVMESMKALWLEEAKRNNVFPLNHRSGGNRADLDANTKGLTHLEYWGKDVSIFALQAPFMAGRSFSVDADLKLDSAAASGVVMAWGSKLGGWSLYLDRGRPSFVFARSTKPEETAKVQSASTLPQGAVKLRMSFVAQAPGRSAEVSLSADGKELAHLSLPMNLLVPAPVGETMDVGRDLGLPVTDYATPHGAIEGDVDHIALDLQ